MEPGSHRWITVSDSPHDHEREALGFLRRRLYDREPYRVWANFEFVAPNGALYEVDALAITDNGVHLIEIKSHPGEIGGDATTWQWTTPQNRRRIFDNPRLLANRKAKALKEVLSRTKVFAKRRNEVPYISEVIFLSDPHLRVTLSPPGRHAVYGRDPEKGEEVPPQRSTLPGIIEALTSLEPDRSGRPRRRIDTPLAAKVAKAMEQAGIRERVSRRRVLDHEIVELLDDVEADRDTGVAYQDFLVRHVSASAERRLRIYPLELNATTEQREAAARAAKRELEHLEPLGRHPGIVAPYHLVEHERGPCLLFDHVPGEQPLDRWLALPEVRERLTMADRLDVVRSVAEALAHAHARGIYHRALCPSAVWVAENDGQRTVRVANWHAGARVGTGDASPTLTGTRHVDALSGDDAALYRAPEHAQPLAAPGALDVFSLGCLAAFVFTGMPPAPTPGKLRNLLERERHVPVEASGDAIDDLVALFVAELTDVDPGRRPENAEDVLATLDGLEEDLTRPDPTIDEPHVTAARRGSYLGDGRFAVLGRIGMGSTAFALLVQDTTNKNRVCVLKVARTPELNERVRAEGAALTGLRHPAIVERLDGPLDLDGHAALLLSFAGDKGDTERGVDGEARAPRTLAARIGEPIGAELLQRWGEDLLDAVRFLEQEGVSHRDIKPENLGLAPRGRGDQLHLVLFDFSLAGTPVDRIDAGTQGYLDPFLRTRGRWDPAAERYSAAVVLYEMATGTKPVYGDGRADPTLVDAPLQLDAALFESSVADGLVSFFSKALAPAVADRYGTADDMLWAWREAFRVAARPATHHPTPTDPGPAVPAEFTVPPGTTKATPLVGLPLSNRALNALEREDVLTVGDLLAVPLNRLLQLRGVGTLTRNELRTAVAALRTALPEGEVAPDDVPLTAAADMLIPQVSGAKARQADVLRRYLGLADGDPGWPTQSDLAREAGVTRQRVSQVLASGRRRWEKQPTVTDVRGWVAEELAATGGLASLDQLADRLAASRPLPSDAAADGDAASSDEADEAATSEAERRAGHRRAAVALLRAALVVEADRAAPRFAHRVLDPRAVVVALDEAEGPGAHRLADYGSSLVERTRALLADRAVVPRSELVDTLRALPLPTGADPLADAHLAELAASLTPDAAVNSRLELYRRGLPAGEALAAARRALVAVTDATVEQVTAKVRARFPEAEPLPARPELDRLLAEAALELRWNDEAGRYETPAAPVESSTGVSLSRHPTGHATVSVTPVEIDVAADFHDRLERSLDAGGLLVLVTDGRHVERAADELARLPVTRVDIDDWLIAEIERLTASGRPSWDLVVEADTAGPGSQQWQNLRRLVDRATQSLTDRLAATPGTVLLTRLGLLARYDRLDLVATWRDRLHDPAVPLEGLWLLVPSRDLTDVPILDGHAVPVLTAGEWARIPDDWLRNAHRTALAPGASG